MRKYPHWFYPASNATPSALSYVSVGLASVLHMESVTTRVYPKVHNEIYAYNNKQSLRSNTKGYGGKTH
jgi:hypothetical protein